MKKIFKIKGMHCNSCAHLIENELKDKVNKISVSYVNNKAEIDFDESKISEKEIIESINKLGYEVDDNNENNKDEADKKEVKEEKSGEIKQEIKEKKTENKSNKAGWIVAIISIIALLIVLYIIIKPNLPELNVPNIGESSSLFLLFAAGILTGFHCIAMCGGFVVSYTAKNALKGHKSFSQHLFYGGSKVISYTIIGGIFGLIGGIIAFSAGLRGWVAILAGVFMVFYALGMFGIGFFKRFQFNPKFLTKFVSKESGKFSGAYSRPIVTGLLNGLFIACGPLQAMYLFAAGSGNFFSGATSLFAFGLGTLPVMLGFGSLATVISHKTTGKILKISAVIVLILGLIMINRGLALTGNSFSLNIFKSGTEGKTSSIINGIQEINMDVDASGYTPNSFVLKKGIPVKWNINVKQLTGCNNEIIVNDYGIDVKLKQGINVIEFTPDKTGTVRFSCWMGMIRGSFIVSESGTASQQEIKSATPVSSGGCSMNSGGGCGCGG